MPYRRGEDSALDAARADFRFSTLPDGWRCLAVLEDGYVRVLSRSGRDLAPDLPQVACALAPLAPRRGTGVTVLDGILTLSAEADVAAPGLGDVTGLVVLDAPWLAGADLTRASLDERQERLRGLRWQAGGIVRFERAWRGDARSSLAQLESAGRLAAGALLARRAASPYRPGRPNDDWLSFGEREHAEMLLCGIAASGALVLGRLGAYGPGVRGEGDLQRAARAERREPSDGAPVRSGRSGRATGPRVEFSGVAWPTRRWRGLAERCREAPAPFAASALWPSLGEIAWAEPELWLLVEPDVRRGSGRGGPRWRFVRVQEDVSPPPIADEDGDASAGPTR